MTIKLLSLICVISIAFGETEPPATQETPHATDAESTTQPSPKVDPELVRRLLGGESSALDNVEETLARMEQAEKLLMEELDCGERTQQIQQQALAGIDKLIEEARKNRVSARGGSQYRRKRESRPTPRPSSREDSAGRAGAKAATAQQAGQAPADGGSGAESTRAGEKADLSRGWGYLPQRDREEIVQGFDEEFIAKYRQQILRYYRQLAEQAEQRRFDRVRESPASRPAPSGDQER